jgi:hypothetical protein
MKKTLLWHLGLGDAIICSALAVRLSEEHGGLRVPCWEKNLESVKSIFVNHPEIEVYVVESNSDWEQYKDNPDYICLGHHSKEGMHGAFFFNAWFYRQCGYFFEDTVKNYCPLNEAIKKVGQHPVPAQEFLFVHDDKDRGFNITGARFVDNYVLRPNFENISILRYANWIKEAKEIHCIDSAFIHLADRIVTQKDDQYKLFYHKYVRPGSEKIFFIHNWITMDA